MSKDRSAPRPLAVPARRLYSVQETAELLSVTTKYIFDLIYSGQLSTVRLGRRRLIPAGRSAATWFGDWKWPPAPPD